ncbi:hypothetical protein ONZ45_g6796 [Pleurotus djamor]|nr:hypothetical protein ONZ45_g6796 [Pleurotus djamor]
MELGFTFNYDKSDPPVLVTEQCERLHITMGRNGQTGPNPAPPYKLHVLTSGPWLTPFVIDLPGTGPTFEWDVPFPPGTTYQTCMFDGNGVSGGCQDKYTVIRNSTVNNPTCQNITFPPLLDVTTFVQSPKAGPMSQHGFIGQCTDLSVKPLNGTPPFTLLIAPTLRPPYQIVSNSMDAITWTVSLSFNFPFFLSLTSNDGRMWSFGPQHSASPGPDDCLAPGLISPQKARKTAVGAGVGSLFAGIVLGGLGAVLFWRYRLRDIEAGSEPKPKTSSEPWASSGGLDRDGFSASASSQDSTAQDPVSSGSTPPLPQRSQTRYRNRISSDGVQVQRQPTYVLHRDGGAVLAEASSSQVIDLPPLYAEGNFQRNSTSPRPEKS